MPLGKVCKYLNVKKDFPFRLGMIPGIFCMSDFGKAIMELASRNDIASSYLSSLRALFCIL